MNGDVARAAPRQGDACQSSGGSEDAVPLRLYGVTGDDLDPAEKEAEVGGVL